MKSKQKKKRVQTLTWHTGDQRTAGEAARTDALRLMGVHMTERPAAARTLHRARIHAALIAALAIVGTVRVRVALGHRSVHRTRCLGLRRTLQQRIAHVARCARAVGPMAGRRAQRIHAALFRSAGEHADAAHALVHVRAFAVRPALRVVACDRHTAAGRIGDRVHGTFAHDRAQRQRVQHGARLVRRADARLGARILAVSAEAGQMTGTVGVHTALRFGGRFTLTAVDVRIAQRAGRAGALDLMALALAEGTLAAGVRIADRPADAVEAIAGVIVRTVLVVLADAGDAGDERIALGAGRTRAGGPVVLGQALGVLATGGGGVVGARVQAFVVVAGLVVRTVGVGLAFGCNWQWETFG